MSDQDREVRVPDIGDFSGVDVIDVLVKPGERVEAEQPLITLETDKAAMDVPAPRAGTVEAVHIKAGDKVSEGDLVITFAAAGAAEAGGADAEEGGGNDAAGTGGKNAPAHAGSLPPATADASAAASGGPITVDGVEVRVPDMGDFESVEIIEVAVKPGDEVQAESPLITLETDKAAMDVPSPSAGRVTAVHVAVGDRVSEGDLILHLLTDEAASPAGEAGTAPETAAASSAGSAPADAGAAAPAGAGEAQTVEADGGEAGGGEVITVAVPDIGDFHDVAVVEVMVKAGDEIEAEAPLITLETDKAAMEVPSPQAGTVEEVLVSTESTVSEGDAIVRLRTRAASRAAGDAGTARPPAAAGSAPAAAAPAAPSPPAAAGGRGTATGAAPAPQARAASALPPVDEAGFARAHAGPSVRRFARELGVDLTRVKGSGLKGRITQEDVKAFVKALLTERGAAPSGAALPQVPAVDFEKFGPVERQPLSRIQKISGPRLHASWVNVPHVTQFDEADITALEAARKRLKPMAAERDAKLTPLAFIVRACAVVLEEFPLFRASLDEPGEALVMKGYTHIGFAADTPNGLVVPVIRDADQKDLFAVARELGELAGLARDGKLKAAQMQGGVFTISSLGGIGGTAFTPIINAPEVAILGVSRSKQAPVWDGSAFQPRLMLPLSLSYDHRVIDGAAAVRFTSRLAEVLAEVEALLPEEARG